MLRYKQIKLDLLKLAEGMKENEALPSRSELCGMLDTTSNTLSKAIKELVEEGIFISINGSGTYRTKVNADFDLPSVGENWGLVVANETKYIYSQMVNGIKDACEQFRINLVVCDSQGDIKKQNAYIKQLVEKNVSGIVLIPVLGFSYEEEAQICKLLTEAQKPLVFCCRGISGVYAPKTQKNDYYGGYIQAEYLIKQGCKHIAYFASEVHKGTVDRCQGFVSALYQSNLPINRSVMLLENADVYEHAIKVLTMKERVDGICCYCDYAALQVYRACNDLGIKVGEDIAVIGYDNMQLCELVEPKLTSVNFNNYNMGKQSAEILWRTTRGYPMANFNIYFEAPEIVERESVPKLIR